jgi:hypothetical protein
LTPDRPPPTPRDGAATLAFPPHGEANEESFVAEEGKDPGNPLIVLGDKIARKPHLTAFLQNIRTENAMLDSDEAVKYAICGDSNEVAVTLKKHLDAVKMVLIGPGLTGNGVTVARMLANKAHICMVIDPAVNPLAPDAENQKRLQANLEDLGVIIVFVKDATEDFYEPLIREYVLSGMPVGADLSEMTPEERAAMIDKRLEAVNSFPSLPDTQRKVSALDDLDPPKKWAEAIEPDLPTKTVILKILNSARYGFRSRVETIDQAVALASAKTIREIVTACQIRQIFKDTTETTIDQVLASLAFRRFHEQAPVTSRRPSGTERPAEDGVRTLSARRRPGGHTSGSRAVEEDRAQRGRRRFYGRAASRHGQGHHAHVPGGLARADSRPHRVRCSGGPRNPASCGPRM